MKAWRWLAAALLAVPPAVTAFAGPAAAGNVPPNRPCAGTNPSGPATADSVGGPITVWLAGDSTMANPRATCPVGWGSQFGALFTGRVRVRNLAIAGRSIQTWLYGDGVSDSRSGDGECVMRSTTTSANWNQVLTTMRRGDYLFVQFGINDALSACPKHVGRARYRQLMTYMAHEAVLRGAHPVLLTALAAITCSNGVAADNRGYVGQTRAAAAANHAPVIDLQALSVALYNRLHFCPNDGDYTGGDPVGAFFCADRTHLETYGAREIAKVVAGALRTQKIPLAADLKPKK